MGLKTRVAKHAIVEHTILIDAGAGLQLIRRPVGVQLRGHRAIDVVQLRERAFSRESQRIGEAILQRNIGADSLALREAILQLRRYPVVEVLAWRSAGVGVAANDSITVEIEAHILFRGFL